jgi:hypothetical protein
MAQELQPPLVDDGTPKHSAVTAIAQFVLGVAEGRPHNLAQYEKILSAARDKGVCAAVKLELGSKTGKAACSKGIMAMICAELRGRYGVEMVEAATAVAPGVAISAAEKQAEVDRLHRLVNAKRNEERRKRQAQETPSTTVVVDTGVKA